MTPLNQDLPGAQCHLSGTLLRGKSDFIKGMMVGSTL